MVLTAKRDAPDADTLTLVIRYVIESEEGEGNGGRIGGGAGRRELAYGRRRQQRAKEAGGGRRGVAGGEEASIGLPGASTWSLSTSDVSSS